MFPMRVGDGKYFVAPSGREFMGAASPNATRPDGRLHWAMVVAHSVRCRSAAFINYPPMKQIVSPPLC